MSICPETFPSTSALMQSDELTEAVMNVALDHDDLEATAHSIANQVHKIVPHYTFLDIDPATALADRSASCFLRSALFQLVARQVDADIFAGLLTEPDHGWNIIANGTTHEAVIVRNSMIERKLLPDIGVFNIQPIDMGKEPSHKGVFANVAYANALISRGDCEDARLLFATKQFGITRDKLAVPFAHADDSYDGPTVTLRIGMSALRFAERLADAQHQLTAGPSFVR